MRVLCLELPWPPSVNHLYGRCRGVVFMKTKGKHYKKIVARIAGKHKHMSGKLSIHIYAHPPDRRKRDLDNCWKIVLDSIQSSGLVKDDNQFVRQSIERLESIAGGKLLVTIREIGGLR